ncbi:hypothetical protein [Luethyella okanaganae]|uniref:Uncharacterized protein n=1 Tax=Luethyella okanaganae TaxID=69372 RepID=A0ABW1VGZ9_9MICO
MRLATNLGKTIGVAGVAAALIVATCQPAAASPGDSGGDKSTSSLIARVAPDQGNVIRSETVAAAPVSPSDPISVPGENGSSLAVRLPTEATVGDAAVAPDGTVVYDGTSESAVDVAVQALDSGAVRIQTIIPGSPRLLSRLLSPLYGNRATTHCTTSPNKLLDN